MRLPNGEVIRHEGRVYDPAKARDYYLRTRKLKGRKKGSADDTAGVRTTAAVPSAQRKQALQKRVQGLETKLKELDKLIAEKEKAAKEAAKPDSASEKAKKARESKKYRDKHKSEIKSKAKKAADKAGSGGSSKTSTKGKSLKDLKMLATKVRGQIQTAKAKLGSL